ncbi:MAG: hypothetical protein J7M26_04455 [Armatimonadetes bacterium]|nr:hypothetical protein [Armatimonadota bacterium]
MHCHLSRLEALGKNQRRQQEAAARHIEAQFPRQTACVTGQQIQVEVLLSVGIAG